MSVVTRDELRTLFLFEKLSDAQLGWLAERGRVETFAEGLVFKEGDRARNFYILLSGTVVLLHRLGDEEIELGRTSQRGVYAGAWLAYLDDGTPQVYEISMGVTEPSRFFVLSADVFSELMHEWFPLAVHLLDGVYSGGGKSRELTGQRERLLALGALSAGLTHELNNPATAAVRAIAALRERIATLRRRPLEDDAETDLLLNEIEDSAERISTLVGAARQYSQLDRAPYQVVDVHGLLDSTLLMLSGKIPAGVRVVKDYDRSLPPIPAYAAELNQAWTNLIDNAVAAMGDNGVLTVRTGLDEDRLSVDIQDTGTGVPEEIADRIFEPFFTTRPVGHGTGLGLDITRRIVVDRHHGDIEVKSVPGDTRFRVRLPVAGKQPDT